MTSQYLNPVSWFGSWWVFVYNPVSGLLFLLLELTGFCWLVDYPEDSLLLVLLALVCWAIVLILFVTFWWTIVSDFLFPCGLRNTSEVLLFFHHVFIWIKPFVFLETTFELHWKFWAQGLRPDITSDSSISSCSWWVNTSHRLLCNQLFVLLELFKFTSVGLWMWQLNLYFYAAVLVPSLRLWRLFPPLIRVKPKLK